MSDCVGSMGKARWKRHKYPHRQTTCSRCGHVNQHAGPRKKGAGK